MADACALGLKGSVTDPEDQAEFYCKLGKFAECHPQVEGRWTAYPTLATGETYATMYAPLEKTPFTPQVIIIITHPWAMLKLAQSSLFRLGGRNQCRVLRHPVGLFRCNNTDVSYRAAELLARL